MVNPTFSDIPTEITVKEGGQVYVYIYYTPTDVEATYFGVTQYSDSSSKYTAIIDQYWGGVVKILFKGFVVGTYTGTFKYDGVSLGDFTVYVTPAIEKELGWQDVDGNAVSHENLNPGNSRTYYLYSNVATSASDFSFTVSSREISCVKGSFSNHRCAAQISVASDADGINRVTGKVGSLSAVLEIDAAVELQLSGPGYISSSGNYTYTASGFPTPSEIEWTLSDLSGYNQCRISSSNGNTCTCYFGQAAEDYTVTLVAEAGTYRKTMAVTVAAISSVTYDVSSLPDSVEVNAGSSKRIYATYSPSGASTSLAALSFDISDASICSVTGSPSSGTTTIRINGLKVGTTTFRIYHDGDFLKSVTVTVKSGVTYTFNYDAIEIFLGESLTVTGYYEPTSASKENATITCATTPVYCDVLVRDPDNGQTDVKFTGVKEGTETLTFKNGDEVVWTVKVTIKVNIILRLSAPETAYVGKVFLVSVSLNVDGYSDTYTWTTSGAAATIVKTTDSSVQIRPDEVGTLVVRCTPAKYGISQIASITVTRSGVDHAVVTFNANGGTAEISSMEVIAGRSVILPDAQRERYVLEGWYTSSTDGTRVGSPGDRYVVESSITLYAHWATFQAISSDCYLTVYHDGIRDTMRFEVIDSIEDTITANLNSVPTIVFGAANRFIMDLGTSRKFTLNISRANPVNYSDSSTDQARWSNGKWLREFLNMIDFWQNFGRDPITGKNTGGMRFHFTPTSDMREMYPSIDANVFVVGTISPSYSGPQLIKLSIPLQVAGMNVSGAGNPTESVTYISSIAGMDSVEQEFVKGASVSILSMPSEWTDSFDGRILVSWKGSDGKTYYPNEVAKLKTGMTLTANWKNCWYRGSAENSYWEVIADGRLMIYAVGGGGSGASCKNGLLPGGAGGAGRTRILTIPVRKGDVVEWTIGKGGAPNTEGNKMGSGNDGEETIVTQNGVEVLRAEGGKGGKTTPDKPEGGPYTGYGGQGWGSGGTSNVPQWVKDGKYLTGVTVDVKGGDGSTIAPNTEENVGKGHYGGDTKNAAGNTVAWMGGSGGGASGLNVRVGANRFVSIGGDGGYVSGDRFDEIVAPESGTRGGGGGSGPYAVGGAGGDGFVLLMFY